MGRGKTRTLQALTLTSVAVLTATGVFAQTNPTRGTLSFATSVGANSNPGLSAVSAGTEISLSETLSFSFISETSNQLFEIFGNGDLSFTQVAGGSSSTSFNTPAVTLHYARDAANSNLDVKADYWSGDVTSSFDIDPTVATFLIVDTGTLTRTGVDLAYNGGLNAPLGISLTASVDERDYEATTDPSLFDSTTTVVGAAANLRISPVTQGQLSVTRTDYSSSDAVSTSSETMLYSANVSHDLARALTVNANVGFRDKTTMSTGPTTTTSGLLAGVDLNQSLPDGSIFGGIQYDDSGSSTSTTLSFGRSLDLPSGVLSGTVTADWTNGSSVQLLGSAQYQTQMSDGSLSVDVSQSLAVDALDRDIKYSTVAIVYDKMLNSDSTVNLTFDLRRSEDGGAGAAPTLNRTTLSAAYSRNLTPDWGMSVGYAHKQNAGSSIPTANSDSIFLTLTRNIQFGF